MTKELPKTYEPSSFEKKTYKFWEENKFFSAKPDKSKKPYTVMLPPPNVTGQLHIGHALDETLQDILVRTKRMQGYNALWVPGTDHAGIATHAKVEAELRKEGLTRYDLGREKFVEKVWEWKEKYGSRIIEQLKSLGVSCDWDRLRFTMDEGFSDAVLEAFVNLYNKGLIYRGSRIINRCPCCATALSDEEVEHSNKHGHLWHIKYKLKGSDEYITVATTRPETMLGDTGIAVNPDDERYSELVGKTAVLPLLDREIPIFADEYVEKDFGTGCVKVTPAHDPNDFEMGLRHNLEKITVIDENAKMNENCGRYSGMDRFEARKAIVEDLDKAGYLVKVEDYEHNVGTCYRCNTIIEPLISAQWFVKMKPLAEGAIKAVKDEDVKFVPKRLSKIYLNWMENIKDWCISRQLWWGHRIPAYYCDDCGHINVSKKAVVKCEKCGSANIRQEEDVLETWFSSALWPFATLGWPQETDDLKYFYPTSTLVTGYDIIFFWVARMIFSGLEHTGKKPFDTVLFHGLVRDAQGRKMSKSLGNGVDPLEVVNQYGADALRFTLATGNAPGNDMRFSTERVEASRNFANKIWNASRFILMNLTINDTGLPEKLELEDKWILSKYNRTVKEVTEVIDKFELGIAADKIYSFIWGDFCDWYIEIVKPRLQDKENAGRNEAAQRVLVYVMTGMMQLLHPFMPFITETVWQSLPHIGKSVMVSRWPEFRQHLSFEETEKDMEIIMESVRAIRNRRSELNVPPSKKTSIIIVTEQKEIFEKCRAYMTRLAYGSELTVTDKLPENASKMVMMVAGGNQLFIPLNELVDFEKELARLNKEMTSAQEDIQRISSKLSNEGFVSKAPENVVEAEREKLRKAEERLSKIEESIAAMSK